jgi:(S)-ureidoglycine aminohydrolase
MKSLIMKRGIPYAVAFVLVLTLATGLKGVGQITVSDTLTTQIGPADTLTAGVSEWDRARTHPTKYGESRDLLAGATRDLSLLDVRAHTLYAGQSFSPPASETADHLFIIRDGSITVTIGTMHKVLGPGGVGLFAAGDIPLLLNTGTSNATCYLFSFQSKDRIDHGRAKQAGGPILLDWTELTVKTTDKGESRPIFSRPVAWLEKIDMHATTLDPGEISHPQHVHRAEEIILLRSGHVRMHIADGYQKASGGDLVFLASGVPHNLENGPNGRCEYFALQWEQ